MYGKNDIAKARTKLQGFRVHSIFYTIQGEGPFAGCPAIFVRFAGCNLRCYFCDTEFEEPNKQAMGGDYDAIELAALLIEFSGINDCKLFVLTGGEPMLQPLPALFAALEGQFSDPQYQIETAGSVWPQGLEDSETLSCGSLTIVTSPKTPKVHPKIAEYTDFWKYIIVAGETSHGDGLPMGSTQDKGRNALIYRPALMSEDVRSTIFVQAMDELGIHKARANLEAAARIAMQYGYRLSVQLHKIVGLD